MPQLATKAACTGCSACASVCNHNAIQMKEDEEGFLQPIINNSKCIECHLCEKVCPDLSPVKFGKDKPSSFAMWSLLDRNVSSSGGAFSAFARDILSQDGIVFGAIMDWGDIKLRHTFTDNIEGLAPMRGSKYIQSEIGDSFIKVKNSLTAGRKVLFVGTPCQVAGLKSYLKKDYGNLLTLDLVCHGVPSGEIFTSYLNKLAKKLGNNKRINKYEFRKTNGWGFAPSVCFAEKSQQLYGVNALYMEAFNAGAIFRESCYKCKYAKIPRVGDCTIADFWGIGRYGTPFNHGTKQGVSLVLTNTEKGLTALKNLKESFIEERQLEEALIENHNLKNVSKQHNRRDEIVAAFLNQDMSLDDINKKYNLCDRSIKAVAKNLASRMGLFDLAKSVYDFYKIHQHNS